MRIPLRNRQTSDKFTKSSFFTALAPFTLPTSAGERVKRDGRTTGRRNQTAGLEGTQGRAFPHTLKEQVSDRCLHSHTSSRGRWRSLSPLDVSGLEGSAATRPTSSGRSLSLPGLELAWPEWPWMLASAPGGRSRRSLVPQMGVGEGEESDCEDPSL